MGSALRADLGAFRCFQPLQHPPEIGTKKPHMNAAENWVSWLSS